MVDRPKPRETLIAAEGLLLRYPAPGIAGWFGRRGQGIGPLDLRVEPGACTALVGPNGSGKSTIVRLLCGLHVPTAGRAAIGGRDPRTAAGRARLGYVPELSPCPGHLTPERILDHLGRLSGLDRRTRRARSAELLERFGLRDVARVPTRTHSRGMRRRLVLAQALLHEPDVLLLDEPTAGLDPPGMQLFETLMREHLAGGGAILIATHLVREVLELATEIAVLVDGKVQRSGPADRLLDDPQTWELVVRASPDVRRAVLELIAERGADVVTEGPRRRPLDALFRAWLDGDAEAPR